MGLRRLMAAAVLAFYVLMPQAAFSFSSGPDCMCTRDSLSCGQAGFVCHCCMQDGGDSVSGAVMSKCRAASSEFNIAHPPAAIGPVSRVLPEHGRPGGLSYMERAFREISIAPPLRPPNPLPALH